MRTRTRFPAIATTLAASLALAACTAEPAGDDDLPEPEIAGEPDAISGEAFDEAVPGVEAADPEGESPNTADISTDENLETAEPGELEEPPHGS